MNTGNNETNDQDILEQAKPSSSLGAGLIGAILLLVGFFAPWISVIIYSFSAFNIVFGETFGEKAEASRFLLLILPVTAIVFIIHSFVRKLDNSLMKIIKFAPILLLVGYTAYIIYQINESGPGRSITGADLSELIKVLGLGVWCTLAGAIIMCFHKEK